MRKKTTIDIAKIKQSFKDTINQAGEGVGESNRDLIADYAVDGCMKITRHYGLQLLMSCTTMEDVKTKISALNEALGYATKNTTEKRQFPIKTNPSKKGR